jgi:ubiquinone biosynthesis monooxygenase Coq6
MQVWDGLTGARIEFDWSEMARSSTPSKPSVSPGIVAYMIENINITTALQKYLATLGGVDIFSPSRVEKILYGSETSSADLRTWPVVKLSSGQSLTARLLVGADGANSPVRAFANITSRGWDYGRHGVVATLKLSRPGWGGLDHKIAYQRFLPTGPVAMLPLPGDKASLVWSTLPERAAKLKSLPAKDFAAMVNAAFRLSPVELTYLHEMPEGQAEEIAWRRPHSQVDEQKLPVEVIDVQNGSVAPFPLKLRHADTYISDRIALVG